MDFDGFLSPPVLFVFAHHMEQHRKLKDGQKRDSDNWQQGIPKNAYMKSMWRHFFDVWSSHRNWRVLRKERMVRALCALMFNVQGYLHEYLKDHPEVLAEFTKEDPHQHG